MENPDGESPIPRVRALRVMTLGLVTGTLTITAVLVALHYLAFDGKSLVAPLPNGIPLVTLIGLAFAGLGLLLSVIIPARMRGAAREAAGNQTDAESQIGRYASAVIVGVALAEGPALMGAVFFLVEGHWLSLLPVGFGVLLMIWKQPTEAAVRDWIAAPVD